MPYMARTRRISVVFATDGEWEPSKIMVHAASHLGILVSMSGTAALCPSPAV